MLSTVVGFIAVIAVGSALEVRRNLGVGIRLQYWSWWERRWNERARGWSRILEDNADVLAEYTKMELAEGCERALVRAAICRERATQALLWDGSEVSPPA